jgi:hypothetical protein
MPWGVKSIGLATMAAHDPVVAQFDSQGITPNKEKFLAVA